MVGAPFHADGDVQAGSAYLFDATTGSLLQELLPAGGADGDVFGFSVDIDADRVVVGARWVDDLGIQSGAAYLYDSATGQQLLRLLPSDGLPGDYFGSSVAIQGDTVLVGSPFADADGDRSGSAYVFAAGSGAQLARLRPSSAGPLARLGTAVALDGDVGVVGAPGGSEPSSPDGIAYLFDLVSGAQISRLVAADVAAGDLFGSSVAIEGDLVVVGAPSGDAASMNQGTAYVFDAATGQQLAKLTAHGGAPYHQFGFSVAISGDRILVGAFQPVAAYLFDATTFLQIGRMSGSDAVPGEAYGDAVALEGSRALVGARWSDALGDRSGAAYVHEIDSPLAVPYCFGDGSGTPCPCANDGEHGHGCASSASAAGASLFAIEAACVSDRTFSLRVAGSAPGQMGVFFQASGTVAGGQGLPLGDGLRCAAGSEVRLEMTAAGADGRASSTVPIAATGGVVAGDVRTYQWWYRDPNGSPCGTNVNLSNGLEITWGE